jgi:hypothetical protein
VSLVRQLLDAGLLDELHLFVHPAVAGSGLRLFEEGGPARHLKLISAQPFTTGVVYLVYGPDPNPPTGSYDRRKRTCPRGERTRSRANGPGPVASAHQTLVRVGAMRIAIG